MEQQTKSAATHHLPDLLRMLEDMAIPVGGRRHISIDGVNVHTSEDTSNIVMKLCAHNSVLHTAALSSVFVDDHDNAEKQLMRRVLFDLMVKRFLRHCNKYGILTDDHFRVSFDMFHDRDAPVKGNVVWGKPDTRYETNIIGGVFGNFSFVVTRQQRAEARAILQREVDALVDRHLLAFHLALREPARRDDVCHARVLDDDGIWHISKQLRPSCSSPESWGNRLIFAGMEFLSWFDAQ